MRSNQISTRLTCGWPLWNMTWSKLKAVVGEFLIFLATGNLLARQAFQLNYYLQHWKVNSSCDLVMVFDIWNLWNMFNLRIIMVNLTALSIIATCNYLHIDHCHMKRAIKRRLCVWIENIQSKCHWQHNWQRRVVIEQGSLPGHPSLMALLPGWLVTCDNHINRSMSKGRFLSPCGRPTCYCWANISGANPPDEKISFSFHRWTINDAFTSNLSHMDACGHMNFLVSYFSTLQWRAQTF